MNEPLKISPQIRISSSFSFEMTTDSVISSDEREIFETATPK